MFITTWNVGGLNDRYRRKRLLTNLRSLGPLPTFLCLQETKLLVSSFITNFPRLHGHYHILGTDSIGTKGGIVICVARSWTICSFSVLAASFVCITTVTQGPITLDLVGIYTPHATSVRSEIWDKVQHNIISHCCVVLGDFNQVELLADSISLSPLLSGQELAAFTDFRLHHNLVDVYLEGPDVIGPWYTRFSISEEGIAASRLDRIYISGNGDWLQTICRLQHWAGQNLSDHLPVRVELKLLGHQTIITHPPALSLPSFILSRDDFKCGLLAIWQPITSLCPPLEIWDQNITAARIFIKAYVKDNKLQGHCLSALEVEVADLHSQVSLDPFNSQLRDQLASRQSTLRSLAHAVAQRDHKRSGIKWAQLGDLPNSYFFKMAKQRRQRETIFQVNDPSGQPVFGSTAVAATFRHFYHELYQPALVTPLTDAAQSELLDLIDTHQFSAAELTMLTAIPTMLEIQDTLREIRGDAAPGPDGLTPEFFLKMWDVVGSGFMAFVHDAWTSFYLSAQIRTAAIVPIPKSLALNEVLDWRPISLLNTVYKILAKILAGRLGLLIGHLVNIQQGGFIKGRGTFNNILQAQLLFAWAAHQRYRGLAFKVDSQKAYDRVNQAFLFALLQKLGLGEDFSKLVMMLYSDAPSFILINGVKSEIFLLSRGIRQGCPLAPLLYALTTQPLMALLSREQKAGVIQGWPVPDSTSPCYLLFADDLVLFLPDCQSTWDHTLATLEKFCLASGTVINWSKCQVKGSFHGELPAWLSQYQCTSLESHQPLVYLGAPLGPSVRSRDFVNRWVERATKMLSTWKVAKLSMAGRILLVRHCLTAIPEYLSSCGFLHTTPLTPFVALLRKFLWGARADGNSRVAQISWDIIQHGKMDGGLSFRSIRQQAIKHNLKWIRSLASASPPLWAATFSFLTGFHSSSSQLDFHGLSLFEWLLIKPAHVRRAQISSPSILAFWHHFTLQIRLQQLPTVLPALWPWWTVALLHPASTEISVPMINRAVRELGNWTLEDLWTADQRWEFPLQFIHASTSSYSCRLLRLVMDGLTHHQGIEFPSTFFQSIELATASGVPYGTGHAFLQTAHFLESPSALWHLQLKLNRQWNLRWVISEWTLVWKGIWNAWLPPKMKVLLWRMVHQGVWTAKKAARCNLGDGLCIHCGVQEDFSHLWFFCPRVQHFWGYFPALGQPLTHVSNLPLFLVSHSQASPIHRGRMFFLGFIAWEIWKTRTLSIFSPSPIHPIGPPLSSQHVFAQIDLYLGVLDSTLRSVTKRSLFVRTLQYLDPYFSSQDISLSRFGI